MMFIESNKVYGLKKSHVSDTLAHCARRAFKACKQGDGIFCESRAAITTIKRIGVKKQVPVIVRKQVGGGWIIYPLFYKSPAPYYKKKYEKIKAEMKAKRENETKSKKSNSKAE